MARLTGVLRREAGVVELTRHEREQHAFDQLRHLSETGHVKLRDIADACVAVHGDFLSHGQSRIFAGAEPCAVTTSSPRSRHAICDLFPGLP